MAASRLSKPSLLQETTCSGRLLEPSKAKRLWVPPISASRTGPAALTLDIKEYGLVVALQPDVEDIGRRAAFPVAPGDQRGAAVGGHKREDRILPIGALVGEIDPGIGMPRQPAGKDRHQDMRRLLL